MSRSHPSLPSLSSGFLGASALLLLLGLAGCLGVENGELATPQTASLSLTLTPPPGISVQITVTGPQGFSKTLTADGLTAVDLEGLVPGPYTFSAPVIVVPTSLVDTVWSVDLSSLTANTLTLATGQTVDFAITYTVRPGSASLFLTRFGDARVIGGWPAAGLLAGSNPAAAEQILTTYEDWAGMALDSSGGIWLLANDLSTSSLLYYDAEQLGVGQSQPMPLLLQPGGRLDAFCLDGSGGIWGASQSEQQLYYWSAATIASGNLLVPDVTLQGASDALQAPISVAFDSVGTLWVANAPLAGAPGSLVRIVPRQFAASGYVLPTVQVSMASPSGIVFDAGGNLWMIAGGNTLVQFGTAQLGGSTATPGITLTLDADATASALAFDALGDLWVALTHSTDGSGALVMLTPSQLGVSGSPTAFVALQTPPQAGAASLLLVDPTPAGLPLIGAPK